MKISIGGKAPEISLLDQDRQPRTLAEFIEKGKVVLAFFPGAFTSTCTQEMCMLRDSLVRLQNLNSQVVGISVNDPFSLKGFADKNSLTFPLLADYNRETVRAFGVELPDFAGIKGYVAAQRSIFIIDKMGIVKYVWIAPKPSVEPDYKTIEEQLEKVA